MLNPPVKSSLIINPLYNSKLGDDKYFICAMVRDETAHDCLSTLLKQCFIKSLQEIIITSMFILLLVNKATKDCWRIEKQFMITEKQGGLISIHMMTRRSESDHDVEEEQKISCSSKDI